MSFSVTSIGNAITKPTCITRSHWCNNNISLVFVVICA